MNSKTKQLVVLVAMFVAAVLLWNTPLLYPIKLFVVILHEMSHGLMAELVGGDIVKIEINSRIGGACWSTRPPGFWPSFLVASAGYLGSLLWGGLILIIASRTNWHKYLSLAIGLLVLWLTYYVIKSGGLFGILFCAGFGLFMLASVKYLPEQFHEYLLKFLGLTSCLYVVLDIKSDLIDRSGIGSDADKVAELTGLPSVLIGIVWVLIAIFTLYAILKRSLKG